MSKSEFEKALASASKKHDLRVGGLDDLLDDDIPSISTGNFAIDAVTGIGGLPIGKITELFGLQSSGKSTCAIQTAVQAQQQGLKVLYMDHEHTFSKPYAKALGLDTSSEAGFYIAQPDFLEQGAQVAKELVSTGEIGLLIFDSVAAMTPRKMAEAEVGDVQPAARARLFAEYWATMVAVAAKHDVALVAINHTRDVLDLSPMGQRMARQGIKRVTTPGGVALKFYASLRIEFNLANQVREERANVTTGDRERGTTAQQVKVTAVKNKVAAPFKSAMTRMSFGRGFSQAWSALACLEARGVVKKATGGIYRIPAELLVPQGGVLNNGEDKPEWSGYVKGESKLVKLLTDDPDALKAWVERARELVAQDEELELPDEDDEDQLDPDV